MDKVERRPILKDTEVRKMEPEKIMTADEAKVFENSGRVTIGAKGAPLPEVIFEEPTDPNVPFAKMIYNTSMSPVEIPDLDVTCGARELLNLTVFKSAKEINASVSLRNAIRVMGIKIVKSMDDLTDKDLAKMTPILESDFLTPGAIYDVKGLLARIGITEENPHIVNLEKYEQTYLEQEKRKIKGKGPGIVYTPLEVK